KFLSQGHKVKITIMFRGREMSHQEFGLKILNKVAEEMATIAKVEASPKVDGRNMVMVLAPDKRAQAAAMAGAEGHATAPAGTEQNGVQDGLEASPEEPVSEES